MIDRRRFIGTTVMGGAGLTLAAGCGPESSERSEQSVVALKLTLLKLAAGLQSLEILLNDPPRAIDIDDVQDLGNGIDGLRSREEPFHRILSGGRVQFANVYPGTGSIGRLTVSR